MTFWESVTAIAIVAIIFGFVMWVIRRGTEYSLEKKRIEAGMDPVSLPGKRGKQARKIAMKTEQRRIRQGVVQEPPQDDLDDQELYDGIAKLQQRINNIETIITSRSAKGKDNGDN